MSTTQIKNHRTGDILFEGVFDDTRQCLEQAVKDGVCLDYADLRHANLVNAALDDAIMRHVRLEGANLMGANLSESSLDGSDFTDASLQNTCFCFSSLRECIFEGCLFGATDIAGCDLQGCLFSTLSALYLNFTDVQNMEKCLFLDSNGVKCPVTRPPLAILGLPFPVIFMDNHLKIGPVLKPLSLFSVKRLT